MFPENSYGMVKRFHFLEQNIKSSAPRDVLDIGCGNGYYLTIPLACAFPLVRFVGVDTDGKSIELARSANSLANLQFLLLGEVREERKYDLVIASEVIEHVEDPEEFLIFLKRRLKPAGQIFLSLPNGYGPFEMSCLVEAFVHLLLLRPLSCCKRTILSYARVRKTEQGVFPDEGIARDTLASSPHVNFFSLRAICRLIENAGLRIVALSSRTFLCGYLFDRLIRSNRWIVWNASIVDRLPKIFASDWMFLLEVDPRLKAARSGHRRSLYARLRRWISVRRLPPEPTGEVG